MHINFKTQGMIKNSSKNHAPSEIYFAVLNIVNIVHIAYDLVHDKRVLRKIIRLADEKNENGVKRNIIRMVVTLTCFQILQFLFKMLISNVYISKRSNTIIRY